MAMKTKTIDISRDSAHAAYFSDIAGHTKALRNTMTGLRKSPEERTHNETEALHLVFTGIQAANRNISKRTRYYQGQIDMDLILKRENYSKLKKGFVIFICTFENICKDEPSVFLKDEAYKVFVNTKRKIGTVSKNFVDLMGYFNAPESVTESGNPFLTNTHGQACGVVSQSGSPE